MKPGIYIQARMDSTRLPGKAAMEIQGRTSLSWVIKNVKTSRCTLKVLTTDRKVDDPIEAICIASRVKLYRHPGDPDNVLSRFYHGATSDIIVRVTADCLGTDRYGVLDAINALHNNPGSQYAEAGVQQGYPKGYGCEAFTRAALEKAQEFAMTSYQKEHVTPWIRDHEKHANWKVNRYDGFDLELNTANDLERIKHVYSFLH